MTPESGVEVWQSREISVSVWHFFSLRDCQSLNEQGSHLSTRVDGYFYCRAIVSDQGQERSAPIIYYHEMCRKEEYCSLESC